jgi:hypothetical protein
MEHTGAVRRFAARISDRSLELFRPPGIDLRSPSAGSVGNLFMKRNAIQLAGKDTFFSMEGNAPETKQRWRNLR